MSDTQNNTLNDILETVTFIKDHAASKEDLKGFATKADLGEIRDEIRAVRTEIQDAKTEIMTHVDDFITLHRKLETELVALQSKYTRLESQIQLLAKHLNFALPE